MPRTAAQHLADHLLGEPVEQWVAEQRGHGDRRPPSYERIAAELRIRTHGQVDVTGQALINWVRAADHNTMGGST